MKAVVIGGTGHIGTYLVPRLVRAGYDVVSVSRGKNDPYLFASEWAGVEQVQTDRTESEKTGGFGKQIAGLNPDVVVDLICFTPQSAKQLVEAVKGKVRHFLSCGTIWVHGYGKQVPMTESEPRRPFGEYGVNKAAIEDYLLAEAKINGFPATIVHAGHIVGPGYLPVNPAGNKSIDAFKRLYEGKELTLPNLGLETLHHVHADDLAQGFMKSLEYWSSSMGESFHIVSPAAVTLRGFAEEAAKWFGKEPVLRFLPVEEWRKTVDEKDAQMTVDHIMHSPNASIEKARRMIDYRPRYTSFEAVYESVKWLLDNGYITGEKPADKLKG